MSKRGPKPTPTAVLRLRGSWRANTRPAEPRPQPSRPTCPAWLSRDAKLEWKRVAPQLHRLGLLTQLDRAALAVYCESWSEWVEAKQVISKSGPVIAGPHGPRRNPYVFIAARAAEQLLKWAAELGMTPSARSRVTVTPRTNLDDRKSRFFPSNEP